MCTQCLGSGYDENGACETCEGKGEIPQKRCPNHEQTDTMDEYFDAWRNLTQYNIQPIRGDASEQPAFLQDVVDILNTTRGYIDRRNQEHAEKLKGLQNGTGH